MKTLVMKFGGAAVANPAQFASIADIILARSKQYAHLVIVVSAMGETTNTLIELAKQVHPNPPQREYDMLISVGERISMSLLAMALCRKNCEASSFTGSQSGMITCSKHANAHIVDVKPHRLADCLKNGKVAIVAGFQGVSQDREITTLGRGGSDTSAVALALALGSMGFEVPHVEFFKDVPAVFSEDPKKNPLAIPYAQLTYAEALAIVADGARILHDRAIRLAEKNGLPLHIRSFIHSDGKEPGTCIWDARCSKTEVPLYEETKGHACCQQ